MLHDVAVAGCLNLWIFSCNLSSAAFKQISLPKYTTKICVKFNLQFK